MASAYHAAEEHIAKRQAALALERRMEHRFLGAPVYQNYISDIAVQYPYNALPRAHVWNILKGRNTKVATELLDGSKEEIIQALHALDKELV